MSVNMQSNCIKISHPEKNLRERVSQGLICSWKILERRTQHSV